jgi:hypothetical protein
MKWIATQRAQGDCGQLLTDAFQLEWLQLPPLMLQYMLYKTGSLGPGGAFRQTLRVERQLGHLHNMSANVFEAAGCAASAHISQSLVG